MSNNPYLIQLAETLLALPLADRETVLNLVNGPDSPLRREYKVVIAPLTVLTTKRAHPSAVAFALHDAMGIDLNTAAQIVQFGKEPKGNRMTYTQAILNAAAINAEWRREQRCYVAIPEEGFSPATVEVWE